MKLHGLKKSLSFLTLFGTTLLLFTCQQVSSQVKSPEVLQDGSVIFRLYAPEFDSVFVRGTFASGESPIASIEMVKND